MSTPVLKLGSAQNKKDVRRDRRSCRPSAPPVIEIPPSSSAARRSANIPLRSLATGPRLSAEPSTRADEKPGGRRTSSGSERSFASGSDLSWWSDTGDLAEQLVEEEDPLRIRLHPHAPGGSTRVGFAPSQRGHGYPGVDKEAIEIPEPRPRSLSWPQKILVAIMTAGRGSQVHGLTGKPLLYFTSVFVSLGVFLFGYDQGVMSGIITGPYFKDYFNQPSRAEMGTMVAILEVGAFVASLGVGRIGDIVGRRKTILYGSIIFFVGGALQAFATGMPMMLLGRIIAGVGVGALSTIVPVYQSEISPPHNRGQLACIEFTGNISGYAASVWVDYFCSFIESDHAWRIPLLMQCFMGALLALGSLVICESPRWLLDNDHDDEGIVVIANLYGGGDVLHPKARDEFREIKMGVLLQRTTGERSYGEMFRRYYKRVFIAMSAQALAQLNGINVISYYAPLVFEQAGWVGRDAILMTGINGITYLLSTVPPWYVVDRWGRRVMLMSGAVAMVLALSTIAFFIYLDVHYTPILVVVFVMIYNAAFGFSWGPIPWLYPPEILPLSIRAKGASISTATNWAFNWLVGEMTPVLQEWITWRLYLVHAFFCAVSVVLGMVWRSERASERIWLTATLTRPTVYFLYPETSGVRLEDMDAIFGDATTTAPTPATMVSSPAEAEPLTARRRTPLDGFPGFNLDPPPVLPDDDERAKTTTVTAGIGSWSGRRAGFGGWMKSIFRRGRGAADGEASGGPGRGVQYRRIGGGEDG
ncbi:MAG: hypothetical protein M1826_000256 [Phylliscum demangeonii]|nr:MAG: hypothetical protein M1826_000256 [Phylliscum demangeonii]